MVLRRLYGWACERLYAELAWSYNLVSWLVSFGWWDQWRAVALLYVQGPSVLEIGFGTGELLPRLAARMPFPVGLELSSAMHRQAYRKLLQSGITVPLVQARAQAMPFADHSFNTLIATFPAPYILESTTLAECARLLALPVTTSTSTGHSPGGGRLVIVGLWVDFAQPRWARWIPLFFGRPSAVAIARLTTLFTDAGFCPTIVDHPVGPFRVGVVIAKRSTPPSP